MSVLNIHVKDLTHVTFGTIFCSEATRQDRRPFFFSLKHEEGMRGLASVNSKSVLTDETTRNKQAKPVRRSSLAVKLN